MLVASAASEVYQHLSKEEDASVNEQPQKTPTTILKEQKLRSSKDMAEAHKGMDNAKEQGMNIREILGRNALPASPLFDVIFQLRSTSQNWLFRLTSPNVQSLQILTLLLW